MITACVATIDITVVLTVHVSFFVTQMQSEVTIDALMNLQNSNLWALWPDHLDRDCWYAEIIKELSLWFLLVQVVSITFTVALASSKLIFTFRYSNSLLCALNARSGWGEPTKNLEANVLFSDGTSLSHPNGPRNPLRASNVDIHPHDSYNWRPGISHQ